MLPSDGLISSSIRYFRHHIWLNSHHFISNENILYLDEKTEAVLAKYKIGKNSHLVLLVLYPDIKKANKAYDSFIKNYFPVATEGIKKMDNGSWAGCKQINHSIIAVFNVSHSEMIKKIFLNQKIPGGKHE